MRNDNAIVKKGRPIALIAIAVIVLMGTLLAACASEPAVQEPATVPAFTEPQVEWKDASASNEETLRDLLLQEKDLTITVTGEIEVDTQFQVKGNKTLKGDGLLRMKLSAEWGQALLNVTEGSYLVMDGPVLDGNYIADGIHMEEGAGLTYQSGTIRRTDVYGIQATGNVSVKDISIEQAEYIGIYAKRGSHVIIEGGNLSKNATNDVYVETGAVVDFVGNATFDGCMGDSVANYGTANVYAGTFSNANSYTFNNYGELNIDGGFLNENGYVEASGSRLGVVCTRANATTKVNRLHVADTPRQAVVTVGGETVITDCLFERTGYHAIEIQAGDAKISKVTLKDVGDAGIEMYTKAVVDVEDLTVDGAAGIGISCRGGQMTLKNISIADTGKYGISCGASTNGKTAGSATVSDVVLNNTGRSGIYVYGGATMDLTNAQITGSGSRGIYIAEKSQLTMNGDSFVTKSDYRGVEAIGKFVMNDGKIFKNNVGNSGAGVYVPATGTFIMNGGSIYQNYSEVRGGGICVSGGQVVIDGGSIYGNMANNNGGGIYAQKGAQVYLNSGSVTNNISNLYGDGIYVVSDATKVSIGGSVFLSNNDVKVDNAKAQVTVFGDRMLQHSQENPFLVTPSYSAALGSVVIRCDSEDAAKAIAAVTESGDGSYEIVQDGKNLVVAYATADMDMTDADTVYVSSFEELKEAVETTTSKRNIIVKANIAFPERLRLPGGVTIRIQDDGSQRILSRVEGYTDNLFVTHYGTGLYLEGTQQGNLVLDGSLADPATLRSPLVRTAGSTVLRNVTLQNNGAADGTDDIRGALLRQLYGDFQIYNSLLTGGSCNSGGAIMIDSGSGYISGTTLSNNSSVIGGGAVRAGANTQLTIADSVFQDNYAGSSGGAIVAVGGAKVTVTDTKFLRNSAKTSAGAILVQDNGTLVTLKGTGANALISGNSSDKGGVFNVHSKGELVVEGYTISENNATKGAVVQAASTVTVTDTTFRKNTAKNEGGAIYAAASGNVTVESCSFQENSGATGGGAIYVEAKAAVLVSESAFDANTSTKNGNGGAVHTKGTYTDSNSSYTNNSGKNGGAIAVLGGGNATVTGKDEKAVFTGNSASAKGSAVFINSGNCTGTVEGYTFSGNTGNGTFQVVSTGNGTLKDAVFTGSAAQTAQADGVLTVNNVTGATLVQGSNAAGTSIGQIRIAGFDSANQLTVRPYKYESGHQVLTKAEGVADSAFTAACAGIAVQKDEAGNVWSMTAEGKLGDVAVARIGNQVFTSFTDALAYANANGGTADAADVVIELLSNVVLSKKATIDKNIAIVNASGKDIVITRASAYTSDVMFYVNGKLTLGSNAASHSGQLTVNGATAAMTKTRILDNRAGATFILARNAVLENSNTNQWGAALVNRGTAHLYGTIRNNICQGAGGAVLQLATANALIIHEGTYSGNQGTRANDCFGGFLRAEGSTVEIRGGSFTGNTATHRGGALYFAAACKVTITGGTFSGNTSGDGSSVYIPAGCTAAMSNASFAGETVFVAGTVTLSNVSGATLMQGEAGHIQLSAVAADAQLKLVPYKYESGHVVLEKAAAMADADFAAACGAIQVQPDPANWFIDAGGKLQGVAARVGDQSFSDFSSALAYANSTGNATIVLTSNITLTEKAVITGNVTIAAEAGKTLAITRGFATDDMFRIESGATLTLATAGTGAITVNGSSEGAIAFRTVNNGGTFVLNANASLINANSTLNGAALINSGSATICGTVSNNMVGSGATGKGGAVWGESGSVTTVSGATFTGNKAKQGGGIYMQGTLNITGTNFSTNGATAGEGGALYIDATGVTTVNGGSFVSNTSTAGGAAIYIVAKGYVETANVAYTSNNSGAAGNGGAVHVKGTYVDTNSSYVNNYGKNGGAIIVQGGGNATVTGTNENAVFQNNTAAAKGTAVFVNSGGTATIIGYACSGETEQTIHVGGTVSYKDLTGHSFTGTKTPVELD